MTVAVKREAVKVDLGARSYDILIGSDLVSQAGFHISTLLKRGRTVTISDETVAKLHLPALQASLESCGIRNDTIILPPGERTKSFSHLEGVLDQLLTHKVERGDMILALGGGVIGDLAGFAASILRRGVDFVQIPTTVLSQVDSSVGGKTGINTSHGKNLIGAFHQPRMVLADISVLETLSTREFLAGYAEIVKYGLIDDAPFFEWLELNGKSALDGDNEARIYAIKKSCEAKARIVAQDEREGGVRALLNLGHTFGHALEAAVQYDSERLVHGEGVAIGMGLAFDLSARMGLCAQENSARIRQHFQAMGCPASIAQIPGDRLEARNLLQRMGQDKKVEDGKLTFILAKGIGQAFITQDVNVDDVVEVLLNDGAV